MKKSVLDKVEKAKAERSKRIKEITSKIDGLEKNKAAEDEKMNDAMLREDIPAYKAAKAKVGDLKDTIEVFTGILSNIKGGSLFGDDQKGVVKELREELSAHEAAVVDEISPVIEKALNDVAIAIVEYEMKANAVEELNKEIGRSGSKPIPWKLRNLRASLEKAYKQTIDE